MTKMFTGTPAAPILETKQERLFRTRIREGVSKGIVGLDAEEHSGPNFAGHYIVIQWFFGSPGVMGVMVDAVNGKLYSLPLSTDLWLSEFGDCPNLR